MKGKITYGIMEKVCQKIGTPFFIVLLKRNVLYAYKVSIKIINN